MGQSCDWEGLMDFQELANVYPSNFSTIRLFFFIDHRLGVMYSSHSYRVAKRNVLVSCHSFSLDLSSCKTLQLPYTAKLSRGETFAVFAVLHPTVNVLRQIVN